MNSLTRRHFLQALGAAAAYAAVPPLVRAQAAPRVVVVGGGFAGATIAKYLRHWGGNVDVTLVDPAASHFSCILSNLVLTGVVPVSRVTLGYDSLRSRWGVNVRQDSAVAIDASARSVALAGGGTLPYDRLVLAPGIDFVPIPGWDPNRVPHAWIGSQQNALLRSQLAAMPSTGGTFVITVPKTPYRCPPGPYERACVVADYLRRNKPGSRVIVLDANPGIVAEQHTFTNAFNVTYAGTIEYYTNVTINEVNSDTRTVHTSIGSFTASVLNVIAEQQAGRLVRDAGLATDPTGRWAPVNVLSYATTAHADIHVIGDSQASTQPKSGHMASSQAKVCADAVLRGLVGLPPDPSPTTNSSCYSPISSKSASWLTASFQYNPASGGMAGVPAAAGEADKPSGGSYSEMFKWADNIFADSFI